jgi:hypothetical protein
MLRAKSPAGLYEFFHRETSLLVISDVTLELLLRLFIEV